MSPIPTGFLTRTAEGSDLEIVRTFRAPIEDVWASITESERTTRWFGSWSGEPGPGRTVKLSMGFEGDAHSADVTIIACDPPRHLEIRSVDEYGSWHLEAVLREADGVTEMRFIQHLDPEADIGSMGPGWEYYLDMLAASRDGAALPDFGDYFPAQQAYYQGLAAGA